MFKWSSVLPPIPSVTQRLFVKLTWDPVQEGAERHNSLLLPSSSARVCPKSFARAASPREYPSCYQESPCPPPTPLPSAFASTSSPLSCPTKLRLWVLAMQGNSHDLQRTRHFHCHRLFFLLPSFCTLGIFHEVKITM